MVCKSNPGKQLVKLQPHVQHLLTFFLVLGLLAFKSCDTHLLSFMHDAESCGLFAAGLDFETLSSTVLVLVLVLHETSLESGYKEVLLFGVVKKAH
jgi:hypothetical protein